MHQVVVQDFYGWSRTVLCMGDAGAAAIAAALEKNKTLTSLDLSGALRAAHIQIAGLVCLCRCCIVCSAVSVCFCELCGAFGYVYMSIRDAHSPYPF
jgi:hypothetical protein